jgi:hypothetical protein
MIFVDDILILADNVKFHCYENFLKAEFAWIPMVVDNKQSCLGTQIILEKGCATIDMAYYV